MIMEIFGSFTLILFALMVSSSKNPVKMSMILLAFSCCIFFKMYYSSGQVWYPLLFFLIFMGGILMMFMILSSILPNEKSSKPSKNFLFLCTMSCFLSQGVENSALIGVAKMVKSSLDSSNTFALLMLTMLLYFFLSISMISKEEAPMRKYMC